MNNIRGLRGWGMRSCRVFNNLFNRIAIIISIVKNSGRAGNCLSSVGSGGVASSTWNQQWGSGDSNNILIFFKCPYIWIANLSDLQFKLKLLMRIRLSLSCVTNYNPFGPEHAIQSAVNTNVLANGTNNCGRALE